MKKISSQIPLKEHWILFAVVCSIFILGGFVGIYLMFENKGTWGILCIIGANIAFLVGLVILRSNLRRRRIHKEYMVEMNKELYARGQRCSNCGSSMHLHGSYCPNCSKKFQ